MIALDHRLYSFQVKYVECLCFHREEDDFFKVQIRDAICTLLSQERNSHVSSAHQHSIYTSRFP